MMIEHENIFYIRDISPLGGVETFIWEMVKKYQHYDIAVVYKTADAKQLARLKQYCMCYQHINQKIRCKVAIINWDTSIIDFIEEGADIYQVIHGDYTNPAYTWKPYTHNRIKQYIGVTKYVADGFKKMMKCDNTIFGYNPLTINEEEKMLVLVSATRLSPIKGKERMSFNSQMPEREYYLLEQTNSSLSTIYVPTDNERLCSKIRYILTAYEIDAILEECKNETIEWQNDRKRRTELFREILIRADSKEYILLICCIYKRIHELEANQKHISSSDMGVLSNAERAVREEFSFALGITPGEVAGYIKQKLGIS